MPVSVRSLNEALFGTASPAGITAFCGGGGKTSLLYALARRLHSPGQPVLCTVTTKLFPPDAASPIAQVVLAENHKDTSRLFASLAPLLASRGGPLLVAQAFDSASGKLTGLDPHGVDALARRFSTAAVLVEVDGAARKPLKAPAPHEPVFPADTALAVAVVGLEIFSRPLDESLMHRPERIAALTGLRSGDTATADALAPLVTRPDGWFQHCPPAARRLVFGNKADAFAVPQGWPWLAGSAQEGWCL